MQNIPEEITSMSTKISPGARSATNLFFLIIILIAMSFVSCSKKKDIKPVNLVKDDKCSCCQATIKNSAFASEIIAVDGTVYRFDDFKCLETFMQNPKAPRPEAIFVKDYETRAWILFDQATIVKTGIATPNGSGKVAFKDANHAKEFAAKNPSL